MTVLKRDSGSAGQVGRYQSPPPVVPVPASDPRDEEVVHLRRAIEEMEYDLAAASAEQDAAYERGRRAGHGESNGREAERIALLQDGIAGVLEALERQIGAERDLAVDIAQAVLSAMIGSAIPYRDLVIATASHHATLLQQNTVVRLRVSEEDLADEDALKCLPLDRRIDIQVDPDLTTGECRFDLTLGRLDASVPRQLSAASDLLDRSRRPGMHVA